MEDHDQSITFVQKYEQELRHFGEWNVSSIAYHCSILRYADPCIAGVVPLVGAGGGCGIGLMVCCDWSGMLRRWDDSQRFLSDLPHLVCEETANYLILWCFRLQAEEVRTITHAHCSVYNIWYNMLPNSQYHPYVSCSELMHKRLFVLQLAFIFSIRFV